MGEKLLENSMNTVLLVFDWLTIRIVKICFPKKNNIEDTECSFFLKKNERIVSSLEKGWRVLGEPICWFSEMQGPYRAA